MNGNGVDDILYINLFWRRLQMGQTLVTFTTYTAIQGKVWAVQDLLSNPSPVYVLGLSAFIRTGPQSCEGCIWPCVQTMPISDNSYHST